MKQKIRNKIFESNSSSSHTFVLVPKDECAEFEKGNTVYNAENNACRNVDEITKELNIESRLRHTDPSAFDRALERAGWITYTRAKTSPSSKFIIKGDEMKIYFCEYEW